jgi:peptide/nickel transport system permease protein
MLTFAVRRLILAVPTLLFISFVIFMLLQLAPGDPMAQVPLTVPPEVKEKMRQALGVGEPPLVQYWKWLVQVFWIEPKVFIDYMTSSSTLLGWLPDTQLYQGELRVISWQTRSPVMDIVIQRIP